MISAVQTKPQVERKLPNSKLEEAFLRCVTDMEKVKTFRRLKAEGNMASATSLATLVVIDQTLYPLLEQRGLIEASQTTSVADHLLLDREPDINDHPEMLS